MPTVVSLWISLIHAYFGRWGTGRFIWRCMNIVKFYCSLSIWRQFFSFESCFVRNFSLFSLLTLAFYLSSFSFLPGTERISHVDRKLEATSSTHRLIKSGACPKITVRKSKHARCAKRMRLFASRDVTWPIKKEKNESRDKKPIRKWNVTKTHTGWTRDQISEKFDWPNIFYYWPIEIFMTMLYWKKEF